MSYEPTDEDIEFLNQVDHGYIGLRKPKVQLLIEDYYFEPDRMEDGSDEQGWDYED